MMADVPTMIFGTIIAPVIENFLEMNIAAAAAIIFVLAVRKPARRAFGPHAIYLLWAIVPIAAVGTFIPSRTIEMLSLGMTLDEVIALTTPQAANSALEAILPYALPPSGLSAPSRPPLPSSAVRPPSCAMSTSASPAPPSSASRIRASSRPMTSPAASLTASAN
jgi:hypothetical protein